MWHVTGHTMGGGTHGNVMAPIENMAGVASANSTSAATVDLIRPWVGNSGSTPGTHANAGQPSPVCA